MSQKHDHFKPEGEDEEGTDADADEAPQAGGGGANDQEPPEQQPPQQPPASEPVQQPGAEPGAEPGAKADGQEQQAEAQAALELAKDDPDDDWPLVDAGAIQLLGQLHMHHSGYWEALAFVEQAVRPAPPQSSAPSGRTCKTFATPKTLCRGIATLSEVRITHVSNLLLRYHDPFLSYQEGSDTSADMPLIRVICRSSATCWCQMVSQTT